MRFTIQTEHTPPQVGEKVTFKNVDFALGRKFATIASVGSGTPRLLAVRIPGRAVTMGAYSFTREYVPAEIQVLSIIGSVPEGLLVQQELMIPVKGVAK